MWISLTQQGESTKKISQGPLKKLMEAPGPAILRQEVHLVALLLVLAVGFGSVGFGSVGFGPVGFGPVGFGGRLHEICKEVGSEDEDDGDDHSGHQVHGILLEQHHLGFRV